MKIKKKLQINKIYNMDCLEGMKLIPDKSIDMILCDLPYGMTAGKWDVIIPFDLLWKEYNRMCKGAVVLFASQPFTTQLIYSNMKRFKYCWYWIKNQGTNFLHAKRMPIRKIEEICVFYDKCAYTPQMLYNQPPTNSAKGCSNGRVYHGSNIRNYNGGSTQRYPTNILEFKCVNNYKKLHPNEKPVTLFEYLIKTYTNEGDLVLDNCMGSGTTAVACINTGRNYIGFELNKEYCEIARKRIDARQ